MKIQHTIAFFLLVAASLTSCEMKDEIFDKIRFQVIQAI